MGHAVHKQYLKLAGDSPARFVRQIKLNLQPRHNVCVELQPRIKEQGGTILIDSQT